MHYLIDMRLADSSRPATPQEALTLIERYILPSLELCRKYVQEKKIVGGGPMSATIGLALLVEANSAVESIRSSLHSHYGRGCKRLSPRSLRSQPAQRSCGRSASG
jgi:hypothetical protein